MIAISVLSFTVCYPAFFLHTMRTPFKQRA